MPGERTTNLKVAGRGYRNLTGITKMLLKADNHGMLADEVIVQRANLRGGLKTRLQSAKNADESSLENNAIRTGCQKASFTGSDALTLNSLNDSKGLSEDSSIIQSDEHYEVKNSIRSSRDNVNCDYSSQSFTSVKAVSEKLVNVKSLLLNARKRETRHSLSGSDISDQDFDSLSKSGTNKTDLSETISSNRLLLPGVSDCKHKKEKEVLSSSLQSAVSCPTYTEKTTLHVSAHTTEEQCRSSPAAKLTLNLLCKLRTGKLGNHTPAQIVQSDVSETQSSLKSVAVKIEPQKLKDSQPHSIKLQSLACHEKDVTSICNSVQLSKPMNSLSPRVSPRSEISVSQVQTPEISEHAVGSDISYANQNLKSCGKSDLRNLLSLIKKKNSTNCSTKSVTTVNNQCSHHVLHSKDTTTIGTKFRDNYLGYKDIGHFTKDCGNNLRKEEVAVSSDMLKSIGKKHVQESENSKTGKEQVMLDDTLENIKIQGSQNNNLSKGVSNCRFENKMMKSLQNNKFIQREITLDGALGSKTEHPEIQNNNFGKEVRVLHDKCENKMTKLVDENYGNNLREKVVAASDITLENEKNVFMEVSTANLKRKSV
ncbi:uncharacterized protein LOC143256915 isoform X1 [Tachypleus tridentatus]|uniref:uncharacterized protein LOC143256915 isoform X1 n=1 Tax=Tachypleus tridentatus TaxID=6853 RepID=UPI003FD5F1E6